MIPGSDPVVVVMLLAAVGGILTGLALLGLSVLAVVVLVLRADGAARRARAMASRPDVERRVRWLRVAGEVAAGPAIEP